MKWKNIYIDWNFNIVIQVDVVLLSALCVKKKHTNETKEMKNLIYSTAINIKTKFNYVLHRLLEVYFLTFNWILKVFEIKPIFEPL